MPENRSQNRQRAWALSLTLADFNKSVRVMGLVERGHEIELSYRKGELTLRRGRYATWVTPATGVWSNRAVVDWEYLHRYVDVPPTEDPVRLRIQRGVLWIGSSGTKLFKVIVPQKRTRSQLDLPLRAGAARVGAVTGEIGAELDDMDAAEFPEGEQMYRVHLARERNRELVERAKERAIARSGSLRCEACGVDLVELYGSLAQGYIECHHLVPLSATAARRSRISDLALLCANCHRMIHRRRPWMRRGELHRLLQPGSTPRLGSRGNRATRS